MQSCPPSINVNCKYVKPGWCASPSLFSTDGNGVAKTSGPYRRDRGRVCHYDNGVNGSCVPKDACLKEQAVLTGYNDTWKCPQHIDENRRNRICCPNPGKEYLLPGKENALIIQKKLCWTPFSSQPNILVLLPNLGTFGAIHVFLVFFLGWDRHTLIYLLLKNDWM